MEDYFIAGQANDHVAMYIGNNKIIHSAPFGGVRIAPLWFLKIWATNITFGKVKNVTESDRLNVIKWAKTQLFRRYQYDVVWPSNSDPLDTTDKYAKFWTCAELIWAAYLNNGIKISNHRYASVLGYLFASSDYLLSSDDIILSNNPPPLADIDAVLNKYEDPKKVDFSGWLSLDPNDKIRSTYDSDVFYRWDFKNDGTWTDWSTECNASFTYDDIGQHTVRLQVKDVDGAIDEDKLDFTIYNNKAPTCSEVISDTTHCKVGEEYKYQITVFDPDQDKLKCFIFCNDGKEYEEIGPVESGSTITISHKWRFEGRLKLWIRIDDPYCHTRWKLTRFNVVKDDIVSSKIQKTDESDISNHNSYDLFDMYMNLLMKIGHMPSTAVCAIKDDDVVFAKGYGTYDIENNKAADVDTIYQIGSIGKCITSTALMQFYEKDYFDLDDNINDYLTFDIINPNFPEINITFRMLLSHHSSIIDTYDACHIAEGDPDIDMAQYLKSILLPNGSLYIPGIWSESEKPGEAYHYSNVGYGIIGILIETFSNQTLNDYCKENIFYPLEMYNTSYRLYDIDMNRAAPLYDYFKGEYHRYLHNSWIPYGAGCARSTIVDLSHFLIAHMNGGVYKDVRILNESTVKMMHSPQYDDYKDYCLGFYNASYIHGKRIVGHNGWPYNKMYFIPSDNMGFIVFSNCVGFPVSNIESAISPRCQINNFIMFKITSVIMRTLYLKLKLEN
jgi:CubicO group peptidase (beta-lactamase class C family)